MQRFVVLFLPNGRAGAGFRIELGHNRQDVPVFGAARLCAEQRAGKAEARTAGSFRDRRDELRSTIGPPPPTAPSRAFVCGWSAGSPAGQIRGKPLG